nr:lipocalin-like domain-containing protein [uncultured Prevotella sp.]
MKELLTYMLGAFSILCVLASCDLEHSDNGDLDGYWHVMRIDTLATGKSCDKSHERMYWAIQGKLLNLTGGNLRVFFYFTYEDNRLTVYNPVLDDRLKGDPVLTDEKGVEDYGISGQGEAFTIEQLSKKQMVLKGNMFRISLKKQ